MSFLNRFLQLLLSVTVLSGLLSTKAQVLTGTSVILGNKHYYIETIKKANFYQAAINCAKKDMKLVSIENKNEYNSLFGTLKSNEILDKGYWLSGIGLGTSEYIWLGTGKEAKDTPTFASDTCLFADTSFQYATSAPGADKYYICEKPLEPYCGKWGQCRYTYSSK